MTIDQVAAYLQLHPQVIYRHVRAGLIPAARIGKTLRFKKTVINKWLENQSWESMDADETIPVEPEERLPQK